MLANNEVEEMKADCIAEVIKIIVNYDNNCQHYERNFMLLLYSVWKIVTAGSNRGFEDISGVV
jgi:hypothetical protein